MKIILASTSPIRKTMLQDAGIIFEAIAPDCGEDKIKRQNPDIPFSELALELAKAKAFSLTKQYTDTYIIGSDQICEFEDKAISKSKNAYEAFASLKLLQGKTHYQNNGTCINLNEKLVMEFKAKAVLTMRELSDSEIWDYIKLDEPIGCAGSYKYERNGHRLFSKIEGSAECIQGFGLTKVVEFFNKKANNPHG